MRSLFFRIIGVVLSFLVAFAVAEVAVRHFSPQEVGPVRFACLPELGDIPVPGQQGERRFPGVFTFRYSNNSLGWRGRREYREAKPTDYRVLLLGDSFTYGTGVNDDQTFAVQVEKDLRGAQLSVEVLNAGCPGKGTDYELKCFQTVGRKFHPDLTVLACLGNDFQDNARGEYYNIGSRGELQVKVPDCHRGTIKAVLDRLPAYNWLLSRSQAANLIKQAGVKVLINRARKTDPDAARGLVVSYTRSASGYGTATDRELTRIYLGQLNAAVKQAGSELMMFYIPVAPEVLEYRQKRTISADERAMQRLAAGNGLVLWSLTPLLAHSGQSIDRLYYPEGHWTAAAHAIAARYLSRLIQSGLVRHRQL
ncbi:MAG: GDSL-type esterase/lipase family protein, partial [Syntrophobacterales bacterium]|nr:GDSL-type esterase/lipase family protein [Syntrophobacterales bacterium]